MNAQKIVKFNLYMSCILLAVFVLMFLGATIAYFSDTKQATTTFTSGNVRIALSEAALVKDANGNLVPDQNKPRSFGTAENESVTDCGRVAAKVTLTDGAGDLHKIMGYPNYDEIDIERLLSGGLLDEHVVVEDWNGINDVCINDRYAMIQVANKEEGKYEFFFLMLQPVGVGESVTIFSQVVFDRMWNNAHMQELAELKIHVQAYGVQTYQVENCLEAMTSAFPNHFPFNSDIK